ncbi:beta-propeller fold lactonase family protein [Streptomyces sp. NPDC005931]|uniref:YVTN family beta-propeller repeat protein n=1 Tax=Streptomyces sp. NPDC005931 TaxID=3364737 RepID=UPI0036C5CA06
MRRARVMGAAAAVGLAAATALVALPESSRKQPSRAPSAVPAAAHQGMVTGTVWVANEGGDSLTAIDASTNRAVATVKGIPGPHNVQAAPDGRTVWTVSAADLVVKLDASRYALLGAAGTGAAPAHVILDGDGGRVYVSNAGDGSVSVFGAQSLARDGAVEVGGGPHGMRPSPDGRWVYVADTAADSVHVIDAAENRRVATIPVGDAPVQVAFQPDGRHAYVTLGGENAVAKIDVATREVVARVPSGPAPAQVHASPDGRYVLAANQGTEAAPGRTVSVIDTETFTVVARPVVGDGPHGITVDAGSRHAFITNVRSDEVAVLDLAEREVVARIPVGDAPNGISFTSRSPVVPDHPETTVSLPWTAGSRDGASHGDGDHAH